MFPIRTGELAGCTSPASGVSASLAYLTCLFSTNWIKTPHACDVRHRNHARRFVRLHSLDDGPRRRGIANTARPGAKRAVGTVPHLLATDLSVPATPGLKPRRCARSDARLLRASDRITCLRPSRSREGTLPFLSPGRPQTFRGPRARSRPEAEARRRHDPR